MPYGNQKPEEHGKIYLLIFVNINFSSDYQALENCKENELLLWSLNYSFHPPKQTIS